jgi:hypothetical protein
MNSKNKKEILLSDLSPFLFWDIDRKTLDHEKHSTYIVKRVLSMGTLDDFNILKALYGKLKIKHMAQQFRYMDERVLHFCSAYFNIPVTKFRCYITRQSNLAHCDY